MCKTLFCTLREPKTTTFFLKAMKVYLVSGFRFVDGQINLLNVKTKKPSLQRYGWNQGIFKLHTQSSKRDRLIGVF